STARSVYRAISAVWAFNRDLTDVWIELESRNRTGRIHRSLKGSVQLGARHVVGRDECHTDRVQPGPDRNAWSRASNAGCVRNYPIPITQFHALTVARDLQLLAFDLTKDSLEVAGHAFHAECIFTVCRKLVSDEHAAASSEGESLDVVVLRRIRRGFKHGLGRRRDVANRQPADFSRSREVRLH